MKISCVNFEQIRYVLSKPYNLISIVDHTCSLPWCSKNHSVESFSLCHVSELVLKKALCEFYALCFTTYVYNFWASCMQNLQHDIDRPFFKVFIKIEKPVDKVQPILGSAATSLIPFIVPRLRRKVMTRSCFETVKSRLTQIHFVDEDKANRFYLFPDCQPSGGEPISSHMRAMSSQFPMTSYNCTLRVLTDTWKLRNNFFACKRFLWMETPYIILVALDHHI